MNWAGASRTAPLKNHSDEVPALWWGCDVEASRAVGPQLNAIDLLALSLGSHLAASH